MKVLVVLLLCIGMVVAEEVVQVPSCSKGNTTLNPFTLIDCSGPPLQGTHVQMCHDANGILISFLCNDNNPTSPYTTCNDPLFKYDVFEVFIAPRPANGALASAYIELELSPFNVMFAANVSNPQYSCSGMSSTYFSCDSFPHSVSVDSSADQWSGYVMVPFQMLQSFPNYSPSGTDYVANMFRIDIPLDKAMEYSGFKCDNSSPACFHMPAYFTTFQLV